MTKPGLEYVLGDEFQSIVQRDARKWDKEWLRYLSLNKDYSFYFLDMSSDHYALSFRPEEICDFGPSQMYSTRLFKNMSCHIWVGGSNVVGKDVLEMGCGPGLLGRLVGRFARKYVGIDMSPFALSIARLTSPDASEYIHLSEADRLREMQNSVDTCVGRHFFIHHNYEDSLWILRFLRDLTRPGGMISADFFSNPASLDGDRRRLASDPLHETAASALYEFSDDDISRLAEETGLVCAEIEYRPELETRFATLLVH